MLSVPLALIGVSITLFFTGTTLNVMVILGIIMLSGIVVNNAIVLITAANDFRAMGESAYEAIVKASKLRLRPILMTTLTTVLGLIPLALELSEGSEIQAPMAKTVMGGLAMATFLTLFVIPALYLMSENVMDYLFKRERLVISKEGTTRLMH
jgi:HAE1 family hydrophobic/amphiphilic exporter-1